MLCYSIARLLHCIDAIRYVDDVLLDAPWELTAEQIDSLGLSLVVSGTTKDEKSAPDEGPFYVTAKACGRYRELESKSSVTASQVVHRILEHESAYRQQYERKKAVESGISVAEDELSATSLATA